MIKPTLALFAIVAIAAMMGAATVAPAYAATKTMDEKSDEVDTGTQDICGVIGADFERRDVSRMTEWSNDKFKFQDKITIKWTDPDTGKLIGHLSSVINFQGDTEDLPMIKHSNETIICVNGDDNSSEHVGVTLHKDGSKTRH